MVLVALKNTIFGNSQTYDNKSALLPTARSYETVVNSDDDDEYTEAHSVSSSESQESSGIIPPRVMSDIIIGLSDGLTVPFALTAGLSSLGDSKLVITAGLAELVSGAISMGLGGFLAARSESEYYNYQVEKEKITYSNSPYTSESSLEQILSEYNLSPETIKYFINDMEKSPSDMVDFIIRFGKGLEEPADGRQFTSAFTIGAAYFLGGFVPLLPYFFISSVQTSLMVSVIIMLITLFVFGVLKTTFTLGWQCGRGKIISNGFQMVLTGGVAAGCAWGLVKLLE